MEFSFERLKVWELSREIVREVYTLTKLFPNDERFGLIDQLRRAAVSIPSNIAEGSGRKSFKDQAHFVEIAYGSLMEVCCQLTVAVDLLYIYISSCEIEIVREHIESLSRQLQSYRRYLIKQSEEPA